MTWKIAICDDNQQEAQSAKLLIDHYAQSNALSIQSFFYADGFSLLSAYEEHGLHFDLLLLDIMMPQLNGFELASQLRQRGNLTPLAFFTTSRDFAVESYEVDAVGYLLKPVTYAPMAKVLDKAFHQAEQPRLALHLSGGVRYFYDSEILYFESSEHATYAVLSSGESVRCAESLATLESRLRNNQRFYRCHRGFLINLDHVQQIEDVFLLTGGHRVPYRVRDKKKIAADYYRYFLSQKL